ncbi:type II toxin-antitoxin system MqsA family antitoxin [bacterium]|nr:type II toxin-antitoxin system MqsA family antitoxin [FCB group bacterium]MBL7190824.1 type II toxin-antitoxin system MqsA family antitoxin [bacterium]
MKCVICKNGETRSGKVTVTLDRNGVTLIFKDVPAQVCSNCGESYIDDKISEQLLTKDEEAAMDGIEIDIRRYSSVYS